jgi:hypothetical protein
MVLTAIVGTGCGKSSTPTSSSDTTSTTTTTALLAGTLDIHGQTFYSFTVSTAGDVRLTLASVTKTDGLSPIDTPIGIGLGVPEGLGCSMSSSATIQPGLTAQVIEALPVGVHCANVFDVGTLSAPAKFALRIVYP